MRDPVFGDVTLIDASPDVEVRGRALPARRAYLLKHFGEKSYEDLIASLPPELRALLEDPPLAFSWVSLARMRELDRHIIDKVFGGRLSPMRSLHAEMAENDMNMAYKVLFKFGSPTFILSKVDIAYRHYFRPGGVDILELEEGRGVGRLRDVTLPQYMCSEGLSGWTRAAVELSGGKNVAVLHTSCKHQGDADCLWELSWK